ncbi:fatty acid desaturase [Hymenobacter negativus]|uniref:Acyl-CoA desaturase n=1 Tax=Hymenobacter negativus TaxID=2795026 RepID=A0ABS0QAI4_9BACT|nr:MULTISPECIES: acyl-CoA desaturase [Bacteria]MBH8559699.1 acyl-CoA desaturase [Hymenobacter negativus]MBH8570706.1 acyl-CoA desaturase [Hymenobacter negativus]MBR7210443.1 acyl-CoA desaturase [Microvirga sp. STS02]
MASTATPEAPVIAGDQLTPGWLKIVWLYLMLVPALVWGFSSLSGPRSLASALITVVTVGFGHSIGLHRGIIHRSYRCARFTRGMLAYLFVHTGLGGPLSWVRVHYFRDYWQNRLDCPAYFRYDHSIAKDYYWNLHFALKSGDIGRYEIPDEDLYDPWLAFLEKTWYLHVLAAAGLIWAFFGFEAMIVCVPLRISITILGHWFVGFISHKYGYARYDIDDATEHGYNNWVLGALSFGEGFHNNHHAHPSSAKMSTEWYELDLGWYLVAGLRAVGLVWDVQVVGRDHTQKARAKERSFRWRWPWQD